MPTQEEMARAYTEQVKQKIAALNNQVKALETHLTECESQLTDVIKPLQGNQNDD